GDIQAELEYNQRLIGDYGEQKNVGDWQEGEFKTQGGVKFLSCGRGQSPRGLRDREARPDYIVIDDLDDDELCRNEKRVKDLTAWVKEALFGSLDVGRGRFIMVGNLISKNSVLQNVAQTKGVYLSKIMAVDKDGEPVWKEKWTREEAAEYADFVGYRAFQKEMMHNPIVDGSIFRQEWIQWRRVLPLRKYEQLICYTDPSFKAKKNDYKASILLGKRADGSIDVIRAMCRQCSVAEMVRWLYNLYEEEPEAAILYMMEAIFAQDILLDDFESEGRNRGYQLPVTPDMRQKPDKLARIESVSPLWERGFVWYNEDYRETADMQALIDQTLALERGSTAHDDGPDAVEGGIYYLQRNTRQKEMKARFSKRPTAKNCW
ncbi:MAG: phage terminase large subunit, partial [Oscillospiraceae bacterium]|nr:phage terminase large subunit [Oscillospiraceae bacterium]